MHRNRNQIHEELQISGENPDVMLRSVKKILTAKQYKNLCQAVSSANSYAEKKYLIYASIQAKTRNTADSD